MSHPASGPGPGSASAPATDAAVLGLDDAGLRLSGTTEVILDVSFDGRRIWSFWLLRDAEPDQPDQPDVGVGRRRIDWPSSMRRYLDGTTRLTVAEHLSGRVLHDAETRFGAGDASGRIAVVNADGNPLGIDKSGRMAQTFDTRSAEQVAPLLDSIEEVLAALREAGIEAFPAYGTLLGAVREGRLIGHDSDADLGYVSEHDDPVDVIRESFMIQRRLAAVGYEITRYSGAAFKVDVIEADGSVRGLDVFGGFLSGGVLYLMGEVGQHFERAWIFPLGTTTLEGRTLPAPAEPDRMLAAMYGPGWKTPDPAFHFETPASTWRRLNGWFRGTRVHRDDWERRYSTTRHRLPEPGPSDLAAYVVEQEGVPARVVDLGLGRGADALWFARQGAAVLGYDYVPNASSAAQECAAAEGLSLVVRRLNLLEWRSVFAEGARLAHQPGPRTLVARHLADSTTRFGRNNLWRLASMALRDGGRLYAEVWTEGSGSGPGERMLSQNGVLAELRRHGADIVHHEEARSTDGSGRSSARVVARWSAPAEQPGGTR